MASDRFVRRVFTGARVTHPGLLPTAVIDLGLAIAYVRTGPGRT